MDERRMESRRLVLRPFVPEDGQALHAYLSDERVIRFEPYDAFTEEAAHDEALRRAGDPAFWAVCLRGCFKSLLGVIFRRDQGIRGGFSGQYGYIGPKIQRRSPPVPAEKHPIRAFKTPSKGTGALIGNLYLAKGDFETWELGFVFGFAYHKRGFATEAARVLIGDAFERRGAHRIVAHCHPDNTDSWRLLERLGFRREGRQRKNVHFRADASGRPLWQDTFDYALLAEEWPAGDASSFCGGRRPPS